MTVGFFICVRRYPPYLLLHVDPKLFGLFGKHNIGTQKDQRESTSKILLILNNGNHY